MPDVNDYFIELRDKELYELHAERQELLSSAPEGDFSKLSDESLSKLLALNRVMQSKVAHSGARRKATSNGKTSKPKTKETALEDLA